MTLKKLFLTRYCSIAYMDLEKNKISRQQVEVDSLRKIAIYLEGIKQGRGGNLQPLGTHDLEQLWNAIRFLNEPPS